MNALERLQNLFRELFQLDVADLDFGIYRLLHLKRDEVEAFLTRDLPAAVDKEFKAAAGAEQATLQKDLKELAERIRQDIGPDALQSNGEPAPTFANAKLVRDYAAKRKQLEAIEASEVQKAEVFNHLYAFFRRYYDDGDFIPRRFYGSRESYAVPYNGEEVLFHWANRDQHYVKTGEVFRDYTFKIETLLGTFTVRFKLAQATTAKDNTKGDVRFFFALPKDAEYDKAAKVFVVPFEYRLPTEAEVQRYGSGAKGQDALTLEAAKKILVAVPDDTLKGELARVVDVRNPNEPPKREEVTLLLKRLRHFTRKNTTDYFIHKNLGGFLRQELEFYIKDQVVQAADLEGDFEAKRRMLRVFRALAEQIITFLHQIEDAQRRLFEKKKFVLRTDYLVPIQDVPRALWRDVLASRAQIAEWRDLFSLEPKSELFNLKGQVNERVLEQHTTLVVDTRHFSPDFTARFLEGIGNLDEQTDGVLLYCENFQALSLMQARYREQMKCVYIDPPYNSKTTEIIYKNTYKHSSWIALMQERLGLSKWLATRDGSHIVAIDENEQEALGQLLSLLFPRHQKVCVVVIHNKKGIQGDYFSYNHDYAFFCIPPDLPETHGTPVPENEWDFDNLRKWGRESERETARNCFYPILVKDNRIVGFGDVCHEDFHPGVANVRQGDGVAVYPVDSQGVERKWRYSRESVEGILPLLRVHVVTGSGEIQIHKAKAERTIKTVWDDPKYIAGDYGTKWLTNLGLKISQNLYPKSVHTVEDSIFAVSDTHSLILDYFAGTGTTGHAVINLNRKDGGQRNFILVEVAEYFDTVLVPRIKKVMLTPDWKDGKPARIATKEEAKRTPRVVKVLRLESYEDALYNLAEAEARGRAVRKAGAVRTVTGEERYRLNYLVKLPLEASDTMLNVEKLEHPFSYTIEVLTDDGPREQTVDLVETFNWLYGLRVKRLLRWEAKEGKGARTYRVVVATDRDARKRILVVWRDMTDLDPKAERTFLEAGVARLGDFEERWINGDCAVPGFVSLDGLFKRLMEHEA